MSEIKRRKGNFPSCALVNYNYYSCCENFSIPLLYTFLSTERVFCYKLTIFSPLQCKSDTFFGHHTGPFLFSGCCLKIILVQISFFRSTIFRMKQKRGLISSLFSTASVLGNSNGFFRERKCPHSPFRRPSLFTNNLCEITCCPHPLNYTLHPFVGDEMEMLHENGKRFFCPPRKSRAKRRQQRFSLKKFIFCRYSS